jgi:Flp pilus assembly pilin Flp
MITGKLRNQKGQGLTEYALILSLVCIAAVAALTIFGNLIIDNFYTIINDAIQGL